MLHRHLKVAVAVAVALGTCPAPVWSVTGDAPVTDTQSASPATGVTQEQISNIPAGGRNFDQIVTLVPGVTENKGTPRDSVNWNSTRFDGVTQPLVNGLSGSPGYTIDGVPADQLREVQVGSRSAVYGSDALSGVVNYIRNQREWPGESRGYNGTIIATGKSGRRDMAVLYGADGVPFGAFERAWLSQKVNDVYAMMEYGCDITGGDFHINTLGEFLTAAKLGLLSDDEIDRGLDNLYFTGKVTGGKSTANPKISVNSWTLSANKNRTAISNKNRLAYEERPASGDLMTRSMTSGKKRTGASTGLNNRVQIQGPSHDYRPYPTDYKFMPTFGYNGKDTGGMTQIDPPSTELPQVRSSETRTDELGRPTRAHQSALQPLVDARRGLPLTLHQPDGVPQFGTLPDHTQVRVWDDGTREISRPTGAQEAYFPSGSTFKREVDGTTSDTTPAGQRVSRDKAGDVTGITQQAPPILPARTVASTPAETWRAIDGTIAAAQQASATYITRDNFEFGVPPKSGEAMRYLTRDHFEFGQPASSSESMRYLVRDNFELSAPAPANAPLGTPPTKTKLISGSMKDEHGNTVSLQQQADGSMVRTVTAPDGRTISQGTVEPMPVTKPGKKPQASRTSGSLIDQQGNTVSVVRESDGSMTRTVTSPDGKQLSKQTTPPPPPATPKPKPTGGASGSLQNPDGTTTTVFHSPDGTSVRMVSDATGWPISTEVTQPQPPSAPATPKPKPTGGASGSMIDEYGNTISVQHLPDGSTFRQVTGPDGVPRDAQIIPPAKPSKPAPKPTGGASGSIRNPDGTITEYKKNADGTTTRTVTDASGQPISSEVIKPEPPTKVKPRKPETSASMKDADGNTVKVEKLEDGSTVKTVTAPNGQQLERTQVRPPTAAAASPAQEADAVIDAVERVPALQTTPEEQQAAANAPKDASVKAPDAKPADAPQTAPAMTPIESIVEDLEAPLPLNPHQPKGAPDTQPLPDGSTIKTWNDGTREILRPSGQQEIFYPDGSSFVRKPDGTVTDTDVSGNQTVRDAQGKPVSTTPGSREQGVLGDPHRGPNAPPAVDPMTMQQPKASFSDAEGVEAEAPMIDYRTGSEDWKVGAGFGYSPKMNLQLDYQLNYDSPKETQQQAPPGLPSQMLYGFGDLGDTLGIRIGNQRYYYQQAADAFGQGFYHIPGTDTRVPRVQMPSHIYGEGYFYIPGTETVLPVGGQHRHHGYAAGSGLEYNPGGFQMPNQWTPERVVILPHGCDYDDKPDIIEYIADMWDAPEWYVQDFIFWTELIFWLTSYEPNDPLYFNPKKQKSRKGFSVGQELVTPNSAPAEGRIGSKQAAKARAVDQWGLQQIGFTDTSDANSAWNKVKSDQPNTIVAVIDSGLDTSHPDGPQYLWINQDEVPGNQKDDDGNGYVDDIHGWNFLNENADLTDYKGHGTLVAGIIAAKRNNNLGIAGINPGAQIMVLKVSDQYGKSHSLNLYRAIHYAADKGARVINISLGSAGVSKLEQLAINYAHAKGAVVVAAAGNLGEPVAGFAPAGLRRALTVGMTTLDDGTVHTLSNRGVNLAITAPGEEIFSLHSKDAEWPGDSTARERRFIQATGTSFAAPIVAATASLILAQEPKLSNVLVEDILMSSTKELGAAGWDPESGAGVLDASKALSFDLNRAFTVHPTEVVVERQKKHVTAVKVFGIVRGIFSSYQVELGKGNEPKAWQPIGPPQDQPVQYGLLCQLDGETLKKGKEWTVRITATAPSGERKTALVPIVL